MTFEDFWAIYPRHDAKKDARKAFERVSPDAHELIKAALAWQVLKDDWLKDDGAFVPYAATWLRGERWTDERRKGTERRQQVRSDVTAYQQWREHGCPHTPRCPSFATCQAVSSRKAS